MTSGTDPEVEAIGAVLKALEGLDPEAQDRVLDYSLRRLGRSLSRRPLRSSFTESATNQGGDSAPPGPRRSSLFPIATDIRSLKEEKKPKSANEMAALVGYYVSELAPDEERADVIGPSDIERYFKQAQFPLPQATRNTLSNAAAAGYFDFAGRGQYRLNAVGHNLVVHRMPSQGPTTESKTRAKKGSRKKTPKRKSAAKPSRKR